MSNNLIVYSNIFLYKDIKIRLDILKKFIQVSLQATDATWCRDSHRNDVPILCFLLVCILLRVLSITANAAALSTGRGSETNAPVSAAVNYRPGHPSSDSGSPDPAQNIPSQDRWLVTGAGWEIIYTLQKTTTCLSSRNSPKWKFLSVR